MDGIWGPRTFEEMEEYIWQSSEGSRSGFLNFPSVLTSCSPSSRTVPLSDFQSGEQWTFAYSVSQGEHDLVRENLTRNDELEVPMGDFKMGGTSSAQRPNELSANLGTSTKFVVQPPRPLQGCSTPVYYTGSPHTQIQSSASASDGRMDEFLTDNTIDREHPNLFTLLHDQIFPATTIRYKTESLAATTVPNDDGTTIPLITTEFVTNTDSTFGARTLGLSPVNSYNSFMNFLDDREKVRMTEGLPQGSLLLTTDQIMPVATESETGGEATTTCSEETTIPGETTEFFTGVMPGVVESTSFFGDSGSTLHCTLDETDTDRSTAGHSRLVSYQQPRQSHQCEICQKLFARPGNLKRHARIHMPKQPSECQYCGKVLADKWSLKRHVQICTCEREIVSKGPFQCQFCGSSFLQKGVLERHVRTHTSKRPYQCQHCGKSFGKNWILTRHLRLHISERPHQCHLCSKSFGEPGRLAQHIIQNHTIKRPHKCQYCEKAFLKSWNLKLHIRTHTGERPFQCQLCSKSFMHSTHLKSHMKTHPVQ